MQEKNTGAARAKKTEKNMHCTEPDQLTLLLLADVLQGCLVVLGFSSLVSKQEII